MNATALPEYSLNDKFLFISNHGLIIEYAFGILSKNGAPIYFSVREAKCLSIGWFSGENSPNFQPYCLAKLTSRASSQLDLPCPGMPVISVH